MPDALIRLPKTARPGEVVELRLLISHIMETGYRHDAKGQSIPRDIITSLTVTYAGETVIAIELHPAIAANPYFSLKLVASRSGPVEIAWSDEHGRQWRETAQLTVL